MPPSTAWTIEPTRQEWKCHATPFGILNVDKPTGITSRDAVNRVERLFGKVKCGHAGTLDPLATGVLVICVGPATRLIQYVQRLPKQYRAVFQLGRESVTDDVEGEVELVAGAPEPTRAEIEAALPQFLGDILQRPPAHSAIKVDGQRAYDLARRGEEFELPARTISIYRLEVLRYEYPELELAIECGSGTYVRSLGRDLAAALGTAARDVGAGPHGDWRFSPGRRGAARRTHVRHDRTASAAVARGAAGLAAVRAHARSNSPSCVTAGRLRCGMWCARSPKRAAPHRMGRDRSRRPPRGDSVSRSSRTNSGRRGILKRDSRRSLTQHLDSAEEVVDSNR